MILLTAAKPNHCDKQNNTENYRETGAKMSSPSLGWERLNDVYYRNRELYQFTHNLAEASQILSISQYTKTIALYKEQSIFVHNGNGELVSEINWNHHINGKIVGLKWTNDENLVVVIGNGILRVYLDFENDFNEFNIGYDAALVGIKSFKVFEEVVFILLNDYKVIYIDLGDEVTIPKLFRDIKKELGDAIEFHDWDILKTDDHNKFNVVISLNASVYQISKYGKLTQRSNDGPFNKLNISSNHEFISLYKESSSKVFIKTSNFDKSLLEFQIPLRPFDISWCGSDAVVLNYRDSLKLIAPGGSLNFFYSNEIVAIQNEIDGLTVLTEESLEFLNKLDNSTINCFRIGSTTNSSILIDSIDKLMKHSPKANQNLKIIGSLDNLSDAIKICLSCALEEFDSYWQKKLLKACSFGKSDIELKTTNSNIASLFSDTCDTLRILNNVRTNGLFLTFKEYKELGIEKVIKLLIKRQKFHEAFQISKFLSLPIDLIFISWACCKIKYNPNLNDEELSQRIISKFQSLSNNSYISFEKIASVAFEEGRLNLSKILINFESLFSKQIPILLKMEEIELALQKSIESQDIDLILQTLSNLKSSLSLPAFFKYLNNSKFASQSFEYFYKDDKLIYDYYNQADRLLDISNLEIHKIFNQPSNLNIEESTIEEIKTLNESLDIYSLALKSSNELKQLQEQLKLSTYQNELTNEFNVEFNKLSKIETLEKLLLLNQQSKINKFLKEFRIPEKKYQFTKLNFFITSSKYDELYDWINIKKPIIGYEPILKRLVQQNQNKLALKVLSKASFSHEVQLQYLIKLKDWKKVIEQCASKKDLETLKQLKHENIEQRYKDLIDENIQKIESTSNNGLSVFGRL